MTKRYGWTKCILTNFIEAQIYEKYLSNQMNFDKSLVEIDLKIVGEFEAEYAGKMQLYLIALDEQVKQTKIIQLVLLSVRVNIRLLWNMR